MKVRPYPAWITRLYVFAMAALAATGMMQMPLTKRYFISDIPGMAWTSDFFLVHKVHYLLAALLLFVIALVAVHWFRYWYERLVLTPMGMARVVILGGLVVSGCLRVYRNLPDVSLDPSIILAIEWVHLVLTMVMGGVALAALLMKCSAYAKRG
ncbi:MAG: 4Fe-4S ferredoxin [Pseudodesulfovibrio sp.]|nr:4Fe-4S ferredoxin [Pseudodesulfovibrio sp.]